MSCLCKREKWLISRRATCSLESLCCVSLVEALLSGCSIMFLPVCVLCLLLCSAPAVPFVLCCLVCFGVLCDTMQNEATVFKLHTQVQNADVEVIGQQEVKCVIKMIFLSAVLFLLLLPFPSCRQAIQDNALFGGWALPF